jgi:hypothetical protein
MRHGWRCAGGRVPVFIIVVTCRLAVLVPPPPSDSSKVARKPTAAWRTSRPTFVHTREKSRTCANSPAAPRHSQTHPTERNIRIVPIRTRSVVLFLSFVSLFFLFFFFSFSFCHLWLLSLFQSVAGLNAEWTIERGPCTHMHYAPILLVDSWPQLWPQLLTAGVSSVSFRKEANGRGNGHPTSLQESVDTRNTNIF